MKLYVDEKEVFNLEPWQEAVIKNDILEDQFESDMERRVRYIWEHKFDQSYAKFEKEWIEKLRSDPSVSSIPKDKKSFVELVLSRPDYKSRSQRDQ